MRRIIPSKAKFLNSYLPISAEFEKGLSTNFGKTITTREPINNIIARGIIPSLSVMLPVFIHITKLCVFQYVKGMAFNIRNLAFI